MIYVRTAVLASLFIAATAAFVAPSSLAAYSRSGPYLDYGFQPRLPNPVIRLGREGVPEVRYSDGWHRNPVTVAEWGLRHHAYFLVSRRSRDARRMRRAADWLVRNQRRGVWHYDFSFTLAGIGDTLRPPWISAMAQGQAMSLLTRAYRITGRAAYLRAAKRALTPFRHTVAGGGVVRDLRGSPFYEEYPTRRPSYVLNGFMFTLLGLYDLAPWSRRAATLYDRGRVTLAKAVALYDAGTTTYYHLGHITVGPGAAFLADRGYNRLHVLLLDALDWVRPNLTFRQWRDRFASYG